MKRTIHAFALSYGCLRETKKYSIFFAFSRIYLQNDKWHICCCGLTHSNCAIPATKTSKTTSRRFTWSFTTENIERRKKKFTLEENFYFAFSYPIEFKLVKFRCAHVFSSGSSCLLLVTDRVRRIPCATDSKRNSNEKKLPPNSFVLSPMVRPCVRLCCVLWCLLCQNKIHNFQTQRSIKC